MAYGPGSVSSPQPAGYPYPYYPPPPHPTLTLIPIHTRPSFLFHCHFRLVVLGGMVAIPAVVTPVDTLVISQEVAIPADLTAVQVVQVDTEDLQAEDFTDIVSFSGKHVIHSKSRFRSDEKLLQQLLYSSRAIL